MPGPDGRPQRVHATLFRCRPAVAGYYDCALYFNREQPMFHLRTEHVG